MQNDKSKSKIFKSKIVVIVGPTASGKSELGVQLAKKFNGEVISADSRQVYRGMDIGTGKVTKKEMRGVTHHLLDVASPKRRFTVVQYRKKALVAIKKILQKGKTPFLVGGTGFYIQAVVDGIPIPEVPPDWKLRRKLEKRSTEELFKTLKKLDPIRAKTIEAKNRRRLVRALEIILKTKKPAPQFKKFKPTFDALLIGIIKKSPVELKKAIRLRLLKRLRRGMITEVNKLRESGLSWKRLEEFGLEYRWAARYLQGKIGYHEMISMLQKDIEHYARRQMTWFKKNKRIHWVRNYKEAEKLVYKWLGSAR